MVFGFSLGKSWFSFKTIFFLGQVGFSRHTIFFMGNLGISLQDQAFASKECAFHLLFARVTN